jgi:hypothetical protein
MKTRQAGRETYDGGPNPDEARHTHENESVPSCLSFGQWIVRPAFREILEVMRLGTLPRLQLRVPPFAARVRLGIQGEEWAERVVHDRRVGLQGGGDWAGRNECLLGIDAWSVILCPAGRRSEYNTAD